MLKLQKRNKKSATQMLYLILKTTQDTLVYSINKPTDFNYFETMKKKSTLLTEAIARAKIKQYELKQKADPLVVAQKRNEKNLEKSWREFLWK